MESSCWPESLPSSRIKAIQELTQGQHLTNKLREMLRRPEKIESDIDSVEDVVGQILGMFDNTLSILSSSSFKDAPNALIPTGDVRSPSSCDDQKSEDYGESIKSVAPLKVKRGCYKRRKDSWTSIKIASRLIDDGYAWRKYGQKVILNAKHQRNYYRCTHKTDQGCRATKQVQKTEDEPPKYKITYSGHHTCNNQLRSPLIIIDSPDHKDNNSFVLSFEKTGLNENKQVDSCFPSTKQDLKDEDFPSLSFRQNQASSSNHYQLPWDLSTQVSQVPSEPMSVMSSGLDHEDMISSYSSTCSTHGYEMDNLLGSNVFVDFPYELCS